MADAHNVLTADPERSKERKKVFVTGAAGRIGSYFAQHSHARYDLRLLVREEDPAQAVDAVRAFGEVVMGNCVDLGRMKELCAGTDVLLHLAADPNASGTWDTVLPTNIIGTYNAFVAAKGAGIKKIVFASSIHAVSGYPRDQQVRPSDPPNPGDLYGVSKCFGESLGRYLAEQEGVPTIVLRIGAWMPPEWLHSDKALSHADIFISPRDLNELIEKSIDDERLRFAIFHAVSNNAFRRLDNSDARERLGWEPKDDAAAEIPPLRELNLAQRLLTHNLSDSRQQSGLRKDLETRAG